MAVVVVMSVREDQRTEMNSIQSMELSCSSLKAGKTWFSVAIFDEKEKNKDQNEIKKQKEKRKGASLCVMISTHCYF